MNAVKAAKYLALPGPGSERSNGSACLGPLVSPLEVSGGMRGFEAVMGCLDR